MTLKTRPVLVAVRTADGDPPPSGTTCTAELTIVGYSDGIVVSPYKVTLDVPEDGDCLFELTPNEILENGSQYVFNARRGRTVYLADIYATLPDGDEETQVTLDEIVNLPIYPPNPSSTDSIAEGATNKYFTAARVRDVVLTGLSTATGGVIAATDTILAAFGKLQNQISSGGGGSGVWGAITGTLSDQTDLNNALAAKEASANKDASGGYAGLTLFKLNLRNALDTVTSFFTTAATTARTWTMPDKDGTVAMTSDITGTNSGVNTGDNAVNSLYSGLVSNATHTGDATGATALTLATVNSNVGSFGAADTVPVVTVNAKGLVTAVTTATITPAAIGAQVAGTYASGSGSATGTNTGDQDLSGLQPIDTDLTAIAALTPTDDDVLQRKAGAWTNRTMAHVKADLVIVPGDIGMTGVALVGRGTTGAGAGGEITVGSGLSLSGSTLSTSGGSFDPASPGAIGGTTPAAGTFTTVLVGNGSATAPSLGWASDADGTGTGFYRPSADVIGYTIAGTQRGTLDASGLFAITAEGNVLFGRRAFTDRSGYAATGITGGGNSGSRLDFTINFHAPTQDYDPSNFILTGQAARTTATTNITGGDLSFIGGAGASGSAGAAHGGNIYWDGGPGYGTGTSGDVYVGNTRGKLRVAQDAHFSALTFMGQYTNATEPSFVNGASFFNTDLDKMRLGGASDWETVTSV